MTFSPEHSTRVTYTDFKLKVPYFSQYLDVKDVDQRPRACGMTSVYMVLNYFGVPALSLDEHIKKGIENGGYGPSGWIHDYFVNLFRSLGYECERKENMRDRDIELFHVALKKGNPVIVSAVRHMWDQRFFHMMVLTGVRENAEGKPEGFFYHDPASLQKEGLQHRYVSIPVFLTDWRHMAIFPSRKVD